MKCKILLFLAAICCLTAAATATDFSLPNNWVLCESDKKDADFDVFYVYPTLFTNPLSPLMDLKAEPGLQERVFNFTTEQTDAVAPHARRFAPAVRQLDSSAIAGVICSRRGWRSSRRLIPGVNDTLAAFQYYLKHFNNGRPYILLGHSQGAMDLYLMIMKSQEINPSRGFVAAYLIGLPRLTANEIAADMAPHRIRPASRADDLGVIIGWNTQLPGTDNFLFTVRGSYCINPLNWRTDTTPAAADLHHGALIYDRKHGCVRMAENIGGAKIDPESGGLVISLRDSGRYRMRGFVGSGGVLHIHDIWFFVVNLRENIDLRVKKWREKYGTVK